MKRLLLGLFLGLTCLGAMPVQAAPKAQVMVIASLHRLHRDRPTYTYDHLYAAVRDFRPDFVGVEIRPEDMASDESVLSANYPAEMVALAREYGERAFGFDWFAEAFEGRPLPSDWRDIHPVFQLRRAQGQDAAWRDDAALAALRGEKLAILAPGVTAASLNDGRYDRINAAYYDRMDAWLGGSPYAAVAAFSRARDAHIDRAIVDRIRANPGRRFVIVMGADHRGFAIDAIRAELGDAVEIVPVP